MCSELKSDLFIVIPIPIAWISANHNCWGCERVFNLQIKILIAHSVRHLRRVRVRMKWTCCQACNWGVISLPKVQLLQKGWCKIVNNWRISGWCAMFPAWLTATNRVRATRAPFTIHNPRFSRNVGNGLIQVQALNGKWDHILLSSGSTQARWQYFKCFD